MSATAYSGRDVDDLKADLGPAGEKWPAEDLVRLLDRAARTYPQGTPSQLVDIACALGLAQLLASSAETFSDYVIAEEQRKMSDIWRQLNGTYARKIAMRHVQAALNIEGGVADTFGSAKLNYTRTGRRRDEFARPGY